MTAAVVTAMMSGKKQDGVGSMIIDDAFIDLMERSFKEHDKDGCGALGQTELHALWATIFPSMDTSERRKMADDIYQDLDPNHDGHVSWPEIQGYFRGDPGKWTDVDKMIHDITIPRAPTVMESFWFVLDIDAPLYMDLPPALPGLRKLMSIVSNLTIGVSICNFVYETLPANYTEGPTDRGGVNYIIEAVCIAIFTVEFLLRFVSCPDQRDLWSSFYTWVDVIAILPFYVDIAMGESPAGALVVLRVLRLLRLLRLLKLGRQFESVTVLVIAIGRTFMPLMVSMIGMNAVAILLFASLLTVAERHEAKFDFSVRKWYRLNTSDLDDAGNAIDFQSIPQSMWFVWVTLTTVGYGDMYPRTGGGKAVASISMLMGLVLMAFPLTLLASSFAETMEELKTKKLAKTRSEGFQRKLQTAQQQQDRLNAEKEKHEVEPRESIQPLVQDELKKERDPSPVAVNNGGSPRHPPPDDSPAFIPPAPNQPSPPNPLAPVRRSSTVSELTVPALSGIDQRLGRQEQSLSRLEQAVVRQGTALAGLAGQMAEVLAAVRRMEQQGGREAKLKAPKADRPRRRSADARPADAGGDAGGVEVVDLESAGGPADQP